MVTPLLYQGVVVGGSARAGALGFPTANLPLSESNVSGIYAARATLGATTYPAVAYADPERGILETHLLDFSGNLYGAELSVTLLKKIRERETFSTDTVLQAAIQTDIQEARAILDAP